MTAVLGQPGVSGSHDADLSDVREPIVAVGVDVDDSLTKLDGWRTRQGNNTAAGWNTAATPGLASEERASVVGGAGGATRHKVGIFAWITSRRDVRQGERTAAGQAAKPRAIMSFAVLLAKAESQIPERRGWEKRRFRRVGYAEQELNRVRLKLGQSAGRSQDENAARPLSRRERAALRRAERGLANEHYRTELVDPGVDRARRKYERLLSKHGAHNRATLEARHKYERESVAHAETHYRRVLNLGRLTLVVGYKQSRVQKQLDKVLSRTIRTERTGGHRYRTWSRPSGAMDYLAP